MLRKAVLQEKEHSENLEKDCKEKSMHARKLENDIDTLKFNNDRLTRRCRKLMDQCKDLETSNSTAGGGGWIGGIMGQGRSPELDRAENDLKITRYVVNTLIFTALCESECENVD